MDTSNSSKTKRIQFFSNTMGKIIFILVLPTIIALIVLLCSNWYHLNSYKSLIISNYSNDLNAFLNDAEENMNTIITSANFISTNQDISYMLTTDTKPAAAEISPAVYAIKRAENFSSLIDSVALYNKKGNFVITSTGLYDADIYFNTINSYNKYPASYWNEYHTITGNIMTLPPSTLINDTSNITKTVVPFVFTSLSDINSNNIIIFNISIDTLFEKFEMYRLTPNTKLYMIDNSSNEIYNGALSPDVHSLDSQIIASLQNSLRSNTDVIKMNGEKYLSIRSTERSNIWGYTYMVTVPYKDITRATSRILIAAFLFMLALAFILLLYIWFGTRFLYSPWKKLATTATELSSLEQKPNTLPRNIEDFLTASFSNMANEKEVLEESLSIALPLSQEKYLIDILNDNCTDEEALSPLSFRYDYFASVSISVKINPLYFASIPQENASTLSASVRKSIRSIFASYFITYELPGTDNILYLLLNLKNDSYADEIKNVIEYIKSILMTDADNIDFTFGIGSIYQGLNGLKLTHQESISILMEKLTASKVQFETRKNNEYEFTANSEGVLRNYLITGNFDKASEFLNNVYENIEKISIRGKNQAYTDIISALKKFMRQRGISFSNDAADYMLSMLKAEKTPDEPKIQSYISDLLNTISDAMQTYSSKVDISAIISYINAHYIDDIGLEELAQLYGTSTKYLSKRIKEYLNVPFKKYLTSLRIDKAKEALETTDITISELYSKVGFQNRGAFINAFKQNTGLTPSEYKKAYKSNR